MAISYDDAYNKEISRVVRNFNQKRNRAIKAGKAMVPGPVKVSELKSRYETRRDMNRELSLLKKFGKRDALEEVENLGGATAVKWEVAYLKANLKYAKEYFDREIAKAHHIPDKMAVIRNEYVNNLKAKRQFLDLEMAELDPSDFRTFKKTINEYLYANERTLKDYRNWLQEVEIIMRNMGYDNKTIDKFFEGFDSLTPEQFITMYRENTLISRIYELYIPTSDGEFQLSTSEEDAKDMIDTLIKEKDEMIKRAKQAEEMYAGEKDLEDFAKSVESMQVPEDFDSYGTIAGATPGQPKTKLTKKQIKTLKALGWYDAVKKK